MLYIYRMNIEPWKSQLRKGAAELAVLALLNDRSLSGTELLDRLKPYQDIGLSGGSMYPLLNRLERDSRIAGEWLIPSSGGRPTKQYTLTQKGKDMLSAMKQSWNVFRNDLSSLLGDMS